jgi:hypothetical protein
VATSKKQGKQQNPKERTYAPKGDKSISREMVPQNQRERRSVQSLNREKKKRSKTKVKPGYGDRGDR